MKVGGCSKGWLLFFFGRRDGKCGASSVCEQATGTGVLVRYRLVKLAAGLKGDPKTYTMC